MSGHPVRSHLAAILLLIPATNTFSASISFDYAEATFASGTINRDETPGEIEGNGIGFALSLGFNPHYAIALSVLATTFGTFQYQPVDTIKTSRLGLTAHTEVAQATEVFGNASLLKAEITSTSAGVSASDSDIGYSLNVGIRHFLSQSFELELGISHFYAFDYPANTFNSEIRYYVRKRLSLGLAYKTGDNKDALLINARMSF